MPSKPGSPFEDGFPRPPWAREPIAFCANLDADEALRAPNYRPKTAALATMRARAQALIPDLLRTDDAIIVDDDGPSAEGLVGICWCATQQAIARLRRAGAHCAPHPPFETIAHVNHRAFAISAGDVVAAHWVEDLDTLARLLRDEPDAGLGFVAKPGHGFAGRGLRRLGRSLTADDMRHLKRPLAEGGVLLEPWLCRQCDFALHGYVRADGGTRLGMPTLQRCDARGTWQGSTVAPEGALGPRERRQLFESGEATADALGRAGYFGPFGIDAFRFVSAAGHTGFRARVEINARYTMAWGTGYFGT